MEDKVMTGLMELEYVEIDGLLYPNIDIGESRLQNLGKFGKARLEYLHEKHFSY
ncbi:MAG: TnpV protein, partial [Oscillospiraceae bacterium]